MVNVAHTVDELGDVQCCGMCCTAGCAVLRHSLPVDILFLSTLPPCRHEEWERENVSSNAADEQATHSPHIAGMIYARNSMEISGTTADRRRTFRAVSTDWHRFLGFESSRIKDEKMDLKRKRCTFEDDADDERMERRTRLRRMNAHAELQRMMQKEVSFRSVQAEAMEAVQTGESPIITVMPTGAGKSMLFMLPVLQYDFLSILTYVRNQFRR